jgi:hypothetical protein
VSSEQEQAVLSGRQRWQRGCLVCVSGCAIVLMACVLAAVAIQLRGGQLPELQGQVGAYRIMAYTTVAPACSPAVPCTQRFADVPLPSYYVIWIVSQDSNHAAGTRLLTIPLARQL